MMVESCLRYYNDYLPIEGVASECGFVGVVDRGVGPAGGGGRQSVLHVQANSLQQQVLVDKARRTCIEITGVHSLTRTSFDNISLK